MIVVKGSWAGPGKATGAGATSPGSWLDSTAHNVIHLTDRPVLVVRW